MNQSEVGKHSICLRIFQYFSISFSILQGRSGTCEWWTRARLENIQCSYLEVLKYLTLFTSIHQCNFSSKYLSIFIRFWIWCVLTKQILGKIMPWCSNQLRIVIFAMFSKKMFSNPISKETGQMHWLTCRSHSRHSRQQSAWEIYVVILILQNYD